MYKIPSVKTFISNTSTKWLNPVYLKVKNMSPAWEVKSVRYFFPIHLGCLALKGNQKE